MKAYAIRFIVAAALFTHFISAWADDTVKMAFLGSLSGPFALQGEETLKNLEAAADMVTHKSVNIATLRELH